MQILGVLILAVWSLATSSLLFSLLSRCQILRVPVVDEIAGLDVSHHGGAAYNLEHPGDKSEVPVAEKSPKDLEN